MGMTLIYFALALGFNIAVADSINTNVGTKEGSVRKMLRQMTNQTSNAEDTLNLPANATSIRENITDTFSCENRTYGYYADVDNDCQIFHVCQPMNNSRSKNSTRRYSFICPKQTIFDQSTLVCARPIDAVDCEDAPNYYDKNMEFGNMDSNNTNAMQQNTSRRNAAYKNDIIKRNTDVNNIILNLFENLKDVENKNSMVRETKEVEKRNEDFKVDLDYSFKNENKGIPFDDTIKVIKRTSRNNKERKTSRRI